MSERWRRELKKLRSVSPPEGLPDELGHRERIATPEPGRGRLLAGVLAFLVFGGTALLVWAVTRPETRGGAPAPSIAEPTPPPSASIAPADSVGVTCAKDGAHVDTPVVRLQHDGVHLDITGGSDADLLYVIEPDDPGQSWSLPAFRAAVGRLPLPPGRFAVGCFTQPFSRASTDPADYVPFTVVDPEGFWPLTGTEDACAQPLEGGVPGGGEVTTLDGQILVEAHAADGVDSDIMVMNADGTGLRPLIATRDDEGEAVWSPDGSSIAFTRGGDIWVANSDGSGQVRLTNDPEGEPRSDDEPAWSPDGSRIAFRSNRGHALGVWVMNADGSGEVPLVDVDGTYAGEPSWSPDGTRIAFDWNGDQDPCKDLEVHVMTSDGSGPTALTADAMFETQPRWSPDGSRIAFMRSDRSDQLYDIFTMGPDGSGLTRLTDFDGYDGNPVWSPDGGVIAFASERDATAEQAQQNRENENPVAGIAIYVMNADGSGVTRVTPPDDRDLFPTDWR